MPKAFAKFEGIRSLARRGRAREPRGDGRERRGPRIGKSLGFETYIKRLSLINRAGFASSVALFIISLLIIFPVYYKTQLAEAAGSLSDTTLSITSDNLVAGVDLLVTSDSGTFASSTSPMSFNVTTNNVTGYMLSISAKSGTDLANSAAGTSFTSLSTANGIDAITFDTTIYNNMWGFKPNYYKSTANSDKFYPSPTTSGVTLNRTDSANTNADTYTIAIGARATYAQPAGTYSNTYVLNAVGNYPKYSFTYIDSLTGNTISTDTSAGTGTTATLAAAPSKDNYEFKGWCTVNNSANPSACTGTTYVAGASFSLSTLSANALNFYTIWESTASTITIKAGTGVSQVSVREGSLDAAAQTGTSVSGDYTAGTKLYITSTMLSGYVFNTWANSASTGAISSPAADMVYTVGSGPTTLTISGTSSNNIIQNLTLSSCPNTNTTYYDIRDGKDYTVRKINDYCWMTQNLRFTGDVLSTTTTNVASNTAMAYYDLDSKVSGSTYSGHCNSTNGYNYACIQDSGSASTGAWYNYVAASAMTITGPSNDTNATYDICPAGWHLPTGPSTTSSTNFNNLVGNTISGWQATTTGLSAFGAVSGGAYIDGSLGDTWYGHWWSATAYNATLRHYLTYNGDGQFYGNDNNNRHYGLYIRCVRTTNPTLYNTVATMAKGTQTAADLRATIATPTSSAPVSSNSGVYEYNSSVFGTSSDASNDYEIYYYRGVLDTYSGMGTYGSDGQADAYPNYVKLANNTCWRIVRTTGSGGVKMIYNGTYGATTSSSCANSAGNAQTGTSPFDTTANSNGKSIVGLGYTYNANYKSTTSSTQAGTLFGTNSSYSGNTTSSSIKTYIDNWYNTNLGSTYTSMLESSAGYCNDRSVNSGSSWTSYSDTTSITTPYTSGSSATAFYFGSYMRNASTAQTPSLTCPRNVVDLYITSSASNGNKQLTYPVALITADEASFAGSGRSTASQGSAYHANSYLRSGSGFWLLSPYFRGSNGHALAFLLASGGYLGYDRVDGALGVRPAISLNPGTLIYSGSGTATDPWTVQPTISDVSYMQDVTTGMVDAMADLEEATLTDSRDGQDYTVKKINGQLWMTRNLAIGCNGSGSSYGSSVKSVQLTSTDSNVSTAWSTPTALLSAASSSTQTADYSTGRMQCSSTYGAWYNYYAATAGTISGSSNGTHAAKDICPLNWRLPTAPNATSGTDFNKLFGNIDPGAQVVASLNAFNGVGGGRYLNGYIDSNESGYGFWWSATSYSSIERDGLFRDQFGRFSGSNIIGYRNYGIYVRCVHD